MEKGNLQLYILVLEKNQSPILVDEASTLGILEKRRAKFNKKKQKKRNNKDKSKNQLQGKQASNR